MKTLLSIVIVLSLALFVTQRASAHGYGDSVGVARMADAAAPSRAVDAARGDMPGEAACLPGRDAPVPGPHRSQHRCACCMTGCGAHCGMLGVALRFVAPPVDEDALRPSHPEALYDGVTRAPPVRPPIV
jgi:hypothetical protein